MRAFVGHQEVRHGAQHSRLKRRINENERSESKILCEGDLLCFHMAVAAETMLNRDWSENSSFAALHLHRKAIAAAHMKRQESLIHVRGMLHMGNIDMMSTRHPA